MKILLAFVLSLLAINVWAYEGKLEATQKLTSYLPVGFYAGENDHGESCSVLVNEVNFPKKDIQVSVIVDSLNLTKLIEEDSEFGFKDYKKEFVQTERSLVGVDVYNYIERILRTVQVGKDKLYVVVSYSTVINRSSNTRVAECVIRP
ncbi:MAG: hypothetical protein EHM20_08625 [Alphaproteobacteria bacterium]|nr:MAG: hypothetical protein EHM20_08625 [Alphaproteobacteria bacterium]